MEGVRGLLPDLIPRAGMVPRPVRLGQNQGAVLKASSDHTKSSLCPGRALALRNLLLTYSLRAPSELGLPVWGGSRPCPATQGCTVVSSVAAGSQVLRATRAQSAACSGRLSWAELFPGGLVHRSRNNADMGQTRVVFVLGSLVHVIVRGRRDPLV